MANIGDVYSFNINGNELTLRDATLTEIVEEIITAIGENNGDIGTRINNLNDRAFDALIKISSNNYSEISNIQDGMYKLQYVTIIGEGDEATETLNNSAILIQKGTNQYLYEDGQILSRTKTNSTWGSWESNNVKSDWNATSGSAAEILNKPTIPTVPTNVSAFNNDANYATQTDVSTAVSNLVNSAPQTLDTLNELAQALGNDANFATTITNSISATRTLADKKLDDYNKQYLTFTALESGTFTFSTNALQYSTDNGTTWTTLAAGTASQTVTAGSKILWKQTSLTPGTTWPNCGIGTFSATGNFDVSGNIMSLLFGDNFFGQISLSGKNYTFTFLFSDNTKLINAENLILPATTLASHCYEEMFNGCTSLITTPELPATTLVNDCYLGMFAGCISLVTIPELPATTLAQSCYTSMFMNCSSLVKVYELPATILVQSCYSQMFYGCTNLNYIKCLATDISATSCLTNWVNNVSASGTFIKANNMNNWTTGTSGIPSGWTVCNETNVYELDSRVTTLENTPPLAYELPSRLAQYHQSASNEDSVENGFGRMADSAPFTDLHPEADCMLIKTAYSTQWGGWLALDYRTNNVAYQARKNGDNQGWSRFLTEHNFNNYVYSWTTATTVASAPITSAVCVVTIASGQTAQSFSLAATPANTGSLHYIINNSGNSSNLTITIPHGTSGGITYVNINDSTSGTMTVTKNTYAEINVLYNGATAYIRYINS